MTVAALSTARLKDVKNKVIGNPNAKAALAADTGFVAALIDALGDPELAIEAAHVVASLALGSDDALLALLRAQAPSALLYTLALPSYPPQSTRMHTISPPYARAAVVRALRVLTCGAADVLGPPLWGLRREVGPELREASARTVEAVLAPEALDVYLPLLAVGGHTGGGDAMNARHTLKTNMVKTMPTMGTTNASMASGSGGDHGGGGYGSAAAATAVAQLLAGVLRHPAQRALVVGWAPTGPGSPAATAPPRSKRGWEKAAAPAAGSVPVVAKWLVAMLGGEEKRGRDNKMVEAALLALAALARENPTVSGYLGRSETLPLNTIIALARSRAPEVQVAACLCITHTLRALPPAPPAALHPHLSHSHSHSQSHSHSHAHTFHPPGSAHVHHAHTPPAHSLVHTHAAPSSGSPSVEETGVRTVLNVVNRILGAMHSEGAGVRARACFVLHYLVADDAALCHAALDRGCVDALAALVQALGPVEPAPPEWEEAEGTGVKELREAALTALASLALPSDDIRRRLSSSPSTSSTSTSSATHHPPSLLPAFARALRAQTHVGTRYAAAQCVRAMSRSVSVLRTGVVDAGLGMDVLRVVLGRGLGGRFGGAVAGTADREPGEAMEGIEGAGVEEDRRVLGAALSAVCNIVNDFSPLRPIYLAEGLVPRLAQLLRADAGGGEQSLRVSALWAVKNLVRKAPAETKQEVMGCVGWDALAGYLADPDPALQEQALNLLRNLAENEEGITLVLASLPPPALLPLLAAALRSPSADVVTHAAAALANIANGPPAAQSAICSTPGLLAGLGRVLEGSGGAARAPAVGCVLALAKGDPKRRGVMSREGVLGTLRRVAEWGGGVGLSALPLSPGGHTAPGGSPGVGSFGSGVLHSALGPAVAGAGRAGSGYTGLEEEREVVSRARMALDWLEHGAGYVGSV